MYRLMDEILIFLCCLFLLQDNPVSMHSLLYCLFATIFVCLYLYSRRKTFLILLLFSYLAGILFHFSYYMLLPLLYYTLSDFFPDVLALYNKKTPSLSKMQYIFLGITMISTILAALQVIITYPFSKTIVFLLLGILAIYLHHRTTIHHRISQNLITLRDYSEEQRILLQKKNKHLANMQETEIYLATLKERNRIAREIHDNVGHMLTRSILQTAALDAINQNDVLSSPIHELQNTLHTAMDNIRTSVHDLHDESVDLENSIRQILDDLKDFYIAFEYDMTAFIPQNIKYTLIAVVKEASNNIMKYSNGNRVDVLLREHPVFYQCSIRDNGSPVREEKDSRGIGLLNMKERIEGLNGTFFVSRDNGFHILLTIPKADTL